MTNATSAAGLVETGGILIGRYCGHDRAEVDLATRAPVDSQGGPTWYTRGTGGLEATLQHHWEAPVRRYYVGEWHFHPSPDSYPSPRDITQMNEIAADERYHCSKPILIVVSFTAEGDWLVRLYLFFDGRHEELHLVVDDA